MMQKERSRIGIVMPLAYQQGGAEALLLHLLRHGSARYEFFCVFLQDGPLVEQVQGWGYKTFVVRTTRLTDPLNYLSTIAWLRRWIIREKPDAVISWMPKAHLYVGVAAALSGVKKIWFQHGISGGGKIARITAKIPADRVLCCSAASKAAQDRVPPRRLTSICYPGVSFPAPIPIPYAQARAELGFAPQSRIVGMVARLERWKGAHIFIRAATIVSEALPGTFFFIVGGEHPRDPAYAEHIRQMAKDSGLKDRLILAGQRPASEVPLWHASADIIAHPVTGEEPFGMAVAEAMGMGRVVVASDEGGPREIIQDGIDGFLVPREDENALATLLIRLLQDSEELRRVAANAFSRGRRFSVAVFAQRMDELLAETIAQ
jgi:glycosyltransferase involved in cell wall biosynthesis